MIDVSVLITCKEKEQFLDDCVSSVLRQTKQPKEIIVVHDECREPMHHAQANSIMLQHNVGVAKARLEAFRFSTGALILFLDGDDMISPDYLEKMTLVIGDGADIAYPDIYFFTESDRSLTITPNELTPKLVKELQRLPIPVTCLMKRDVYLKNGGFSDTWKVMEDLDFWLQAMCNGYTFAKAQTLFWYRLQPGSRNQEVDKAVRKTVIAEILKQFIIEEKSITRHA